ncbi:MAG TPA: RecQ family ATP-dependent DNA helicase [Bacillota bacterium]|nr:RecQ family ATP-dependent DNA helicase [Bacillota bacterium]
MREKGLVLLKRMLGRTAEFHYDQWESIESVLNRKKTLVVQRTGWGKSTVYFIATKLLREQGSGPTVLISPLLSLMRNQIENAAKIGISAETINSDNNDDWERVEQCLVEGKCDILLLSPERLGNQDFVTRILPNIKGGIGMFVVDEAHCISDWGHDFRPDYRRIIRIINTLPPNVPVLATTATANQRVVEDIQEQLGKDLVVIRGPLTRESLRLQTIRLNDQAERLAWLYENITKIEGSGIIYCLTTSDCNKVAKWLRKKGINALEYHTRLSENEEEKRELEEEREQMLMQNKVKALVSTIKLGMGYDKPDLAFVIHYQRPGSLVEYYQQIGRAGRKLDNAYAILLNGSEDDEIQEFFISKAFPTQEEMQKVVALIEDSENGLKENDILKGLNMSQGRLRNCLKLLTIDMVISKENSIYTRTLNPWNPDLVRSRRVTEQRYAELEKIKEFVDLQSCYMKFISQQLDDPFAEDCGKCSNCEGKKFFSEKVSRDNVIEAIRFLQGEFLEIPPRKMWPAGIIAPTGKKIPESEQNKIGKVLCTYGDAGWGKYVRQDKYDNNHFRDELVDASVDLIRNHWHMESMPEWVTSIPSIRRPELVRNFAQRVAKKLGLPYLGVVIKIKDTQMQKLMQNGFQQSKNAYEGFGVSGNCPEGPVLLIDDMVDSGWTFAVCGALLKRAGSGDVYPFALTSTSKLEGGE